MRTNADGLPMEFWTDEELIAEFHKEGLYLEDEPRIDTRWAMPLTRERTYTRTSMANLMGSLGSLGAAGSAMHRRAMQDQQAATQRMMELEVAQKIREAETRALLNQRADRLTRDIWALRSSGMLP